MFYTCSCICMILYLQELTGVQSKCQDGRHLFITITQDASYTDNIKNKGESKYSLNFTVNGVCDGVPSEIHDSSNKGKYTCISKTAASSIIYNLDVMKKII